MRTRRPYQLQTPRPVDDFLERGSESYAQPDYQDLGLVPKGYQPKQLGKGGSVYVGGESGPGLRAGKNARSTENRSADTMDSREKLYRIISERMMDILRKLACKSYLTREFSLFKVAPEDERGVSNIVERFLRRGDITWEQGDILLENRKATAWLIFESLRYFEKR